MSVESGKSDTSELDNISLTGSLNVSPKKKSKKKISLFHRKKKKDKKKELSEDITKETSSNSVPNCLPIDSTNRTPVHSNNSTPIHSTNNIAELHSTPSTPNKDQPVNDQNEDPIAQTLVTEMSDLQTQETVPTHRADVNEHRWNGSLRGSFRQKSPSKEPKTHKLEVMLRSGENLAPRDSNGKSDPYVKFKVGGNTVFKSKYCKETLDPIWDEEFATQVHLQSAVSIRVYDRDRATRDDFMGEGRIDLSCLDESFTPVTIHLEDEDTDEELGYIHVEMRLSLIEKVAEEPSKHRSDVEAIVEKTPVPTSNAEKSMKSRRDTLKHGRSGSNASRSQGHVAVATLQLVSGSNLPARDTNGLSDPYVKLSLGKAKRKKSKTCMKTLNPMWKEEFCFHLTNPDSSILDISVWDYDTYRKDDFIGRCELDLWSLKREETHSLSLNLIDTPGSILVLVTVQEIEPEENFLTSYDLNELRVKYGLMSTFSDLKDVGFAEIRIISASGLSSADINGKSDPFCVVQLCNARAQTKTCYKTLDPVWNRVFKFSVRDVHDVFNITVFDEDANFEKEFLGRVEVPILRSSNGDVQIYALKDKKLKERVKGTIKLQINYLFNPARAAIRTFNPREEMLMEEIAKFKKNLLLQNFRRVWRIVQSIISMAEFVNSFFTWQNKTRSAIAFLMYLLVVWNFELYMLPVALLMLLMKNYVDIYVRKTRPPRHLMNAEEAERESGDDDDDEEEDSKSSGLLNKIRAVEEVLGKVQNILDSIACFGERIYNTVTWSVPYLSWLLAIVLVIVWIILYFIPLRVILILWGINKFTKRLRKPNYVPNNEVMDYLSRIPSNIQLDKYRVYPKHSSSPNTSKKKR